MANSDFSTLSLRNKSSLVTAIHKEITYYSSTFCIRERVYINKLSKAKNNIFWLEDETKKLVAFAIMDPNYEFETDGIKIKTIGHTISKRPGYMERILRHIFNTHAGQTVAVLCKEFVANSLDLASFGAKNINPLELQERWPSLAKTSSDYFNVNENFVSGLIRKQHNFYIKLSKEDESKLKSKGIILL